MATKQELIDQVSTYFDGAYEVTKGTVIPNIEDIEFGKKGRELELAMLFIDVRESTKIVDGFRRETAAKMYKSFLWGVSQIARANGGALRSFNGDGVLMAFIGDNKCTSAAKAALQMAWFCKEVLRPKVEAYMSKNSQLDSMDFNFGIGIDVGKVLVVRGGMKGTNNNDLVWVGNATNYAVKLSGIKNPDMPIFISKEVYTKMAESSKFGGDPKRNMWSKRRWVEMNDMDAYGSSWTWSV